MHHGGGGGWHGGGGGWHGGGGGWHGGGGWGYHPYYGWGWGNGWGGGGVVPFLGGMAVGSLASGGYGNNSSPPVIINNQPPQAPPGPIIVQQHANQPPPPPTLADGSVLVRVQIPTGIQPGDAIVFKFHEKQFQVTCPPDKSGGQEMAIYVPLNMDHVITAERVDTTSVKETIRSPIFVDVIKDHTVSELDPVNQEHNIISASKGDVGILLSGTLDKGLDPPYQDYCLVKILSKSSLQKVGKISRYVLRAKNDDGVPSAQR